MRSNSKPLTQRQLRVAEQIRHLMAQTFMRGNLPDELINCPPVSVMEARVSPDFSYCKVFVLPLGGDIDSAISLAKDLNLYRGYFRKILSKELRLRVAPEVRFYADGTTQEVDKIDALLKSEVVMRDVMRDLMKVSEPDEP